MFYYFLFGFSSLYFISWLLFCRDVQAERSASGVCYGKFKVRLLHFVVKIKVQEYFSFATYTPHTTLEPSNYFSMNTLGISWSPISVWMKKRISQELGFVYNVTYSVRESGWLAELWDIDLARCQLVFGACVVKREHITLQPSFKESNSLLKHLHSSTGN